MAQPNKVFTVLLLSAALLVANAAAAQESGDIERQLSALAERIVLMQETHLEQIAALESRIAQLEGQLPSESAPAPEPIYTAAPAASSAANGGLQIGLSGLFAGGGASVPNETIQSLQAGAHDPNQNGFSVQNVELTLGATVDNYFDAKANVIFQIDSDGETVVELEEAYFLTRSLPYGLQVKGGQFYTEFGRQNVQHPHSWAFVDQPVVLSRFFGGDGLRSQGARVSWLAPADWYSEILVGVQNAKGETATSFLGEAGEDVAGYSLLERDARNPDDLLYSLRWLNGFDLSDELSVNLGVSGLWGPNATGASSKTQIYGADWYLKWSPLRNQRGFPFVSWHTELLWRDYDVQDPMFATTLNDRGLFTQALWGIKPGWVAGLRWEYASADGDTTLDPLRDTRRRASSNLTWYPTEYSKLRFQYNRDWAQHLNEGSADAFWLQFEFSLGSHAAHVF